MEHTENPPYWFWHQGIVNNNIVSSESIQLFFYEMEIAENSVSIITAVR